jgi:hypothetical protein
MAKRPYAQRFWAMVHKGGWSDGCWWWMGRVDTSGYGECQFRGKLTRANRVAWILTRGEIPEGLFVCHQCDHPWCTNPDHLFLGTPTDNMRDMAEKRRKRSPVHAVGE